MDMTLSDDQFNYNPDEYADQGVTILPDPGEYAVRATSMNRKKDRTTGEPILVDGIFPTLVLNRLEIVEPEDEGTYAVFADVRTKPFARKISKTKSVNVAPMVDLIRAIDVNLSTEVEDFPTSIEVAERELNQGATFHVKLGYKAVDYDAAKAALAKVSAGDTDGVRKAWNENTFYTKAFRRPDNTGYNTTLKAPSGKVLEAKLVVDGFVASNKRGKVGAF